MRNRFSVAAISIAVWLSLVGAAVCAAARPVRAEPTAGPLRLHQQNSRYFADAGGRAVYLTGSHTWAGFQERGVEGQTPDFDYPAFLDFLQRHGHNFLRLWVWEHAQWMQFLDKDVPVRYKPLPYARTGPGQSLDGRPKFDLTKFDPAYFDRLRERARAAQDRGIYVAVMLFQGFSVSKNRGDASKGNAWRGHPFHPANNINSVNGDPGGKDTGHAVHTLEVPAVTALQEAYVRKVIETVGDLDNVLWEIGNECETDSVAWQVHMIAFIRKVEADRPMRHPIGMTGAPIGNADLWRSPADWVSPISKEYLNDPPPADGRKVVIVDTDHTSPWGFDPQWVWKNLLRGNHFIVMDGYRDYRTGSPAQPKAEFEPIRRAMGQARRWAERVNLAAMAPRPDLASTRYCLADPGREYLVYLPEGGAVTVDLSAAKGELAAEWYDPVSGKPVGALRVPGGARRDLAAPFQGPAVLYAAATEVGGVRARD